MLFFCGEVFCLETDAVVVMSIEVVITSVSIQPAERCLLQGKLLALHSSHHPLLLITCKAVTASDSVAGFLRSFLVKTGGLHTRDRKLSLSHHGMYPCQACVM